MERGFYHDDRGYWQTVGSVSDEIIEAYPAGTVEIPLKPGADHEWVNGAWTPVAPPPPTQDDYATAIQKHVDDAAREKGYNDGATLASYVTSTIAAWAGEASAFVIWRDGVWAYALAQLAAVQSGQRPAPSVGDFLEELPGIVWPD